MSNFSEYRDLLEQAKLKERSGLYSGARDAYTEIEKALGDRDTTEAGAEELVGAIFGQVQCQIADFLSHGDLYFRNPSPNLSRDEVKKKIGKVAHGNNEYFYSILVVGFSQMEKLFASERWEVQARYFYLERRSASTYLYWHRFRRKLRERQLGRALPELAKCLGNSILSVTSGYGERPWRWFACSLLIIFTYSIIFRNYHLLSWNVSDLKLVNPPDMFSTIYYCVITFITVGYGDIVPNCQLGRFVAMLVGVSGYLMFGVLISIITRKMVR